MMAFITMLWSGLFDPARRWSYRAFLVLLIATVIVLTGHELPSTWVSVAQWFVAGEALRVSAGAVAGAIRSLRVPPGADVGEG